MPLFWCTALPLLVSLTSDLWPCGQHFRTRSKSSSVHQFRSSPCPRSLCFSSSKHRSPCRLVLSCCLASLSRLLDTVRCVARTEESLLSSVKKYPDSASGVGLGQMKVVCQGRDLSSLTRCNGPRSRFPLANVLWQFVQCDLMSCGLRGKSPHIEDCAHETLYSRRCVWSVSRDQRSPCHATALFMSVIPLITASAGPLAFITPRRGRVSWPLSRHLL